MELKFDISKTYAFALEGGGARGAYQAGAFKAFCESGVKYNAVAGTSVGALNGGLMAMRDPELSEEIWNNMTFSTVMDVDDNTMKKVFGGKLFELDIKNINIRLKQIIGDGGFDATPLRNLLKKNIDEEKLLNSGVSLFVNTYSVTDKKELDIDVKDLKGGEIADMLFASAYFPAFKQEALGGKIYADGGVKNVLPLSSLISRGYKDIIAIRLYGYGVEKKVKIPKNTTITELAPKRDLGPMLNFDTNACRKNFLLGYYDAKRLLFGLFGKKFYIDRTLSESEAYQLLSKITTDFHKKENPSLRKINESYLTRLGREINAKGDYYDLFIGLLESAADKLGINEFKILTDMELYNRILSLSKGKRVFFGALKYFTNEK